MLSKILKIFNYFKKTAYMMVGQPDYDNYVHHLRSKHPERQPMSYQEFIRERQRARYEKGQGKCC